MDRQREWAAWAFCRISPKSSASASARYAVRFADGTIRGERPSPHRLRVGPVEREWVRRHWPTVSGLHEVLRTEPSVRLAVLFGSGAHGREHARSDLDLLVDLDEPNPVRLATLEERLGAAAGREVQLAALGDAGRSPGLMADALRDGRPLVDRDHRWASLKGREPEARRTAERGEREQLERALSPLEAAR